MREDEDSRLCPKNKAVEGGRDVRISIMTKIEDALIAGGILFLEPGDTRTGGPGSAVQGVVRMKALLGARLHVKLARGALGKGSKCVQLTMQQSRLEAIDDWRVKQRPIPSRNEAIQRLIDLGLQIEVEPEPEVR